jgi:Farnesoic acid 0-methyl transferase
MLTFEALVVCGDTGDYVTLRTNGSVSSQIVYNTSTIMVDGHRHMLLRITACHSAYLALSFLPGKTSTYTYEVALGINDNTKSELRTSVGGNAVAEFDGQVLACEYGNDFWISWTVSGISIGYGTRFGANAMLQWEDGDTGHDVNAVSFASRSPAQWLMSTVIGMIFVFIIKQNYS